VLEGQLVGLVALGGLVAHALDLRLVVVGGVLVLRGVLGGVLCHFALGLALVGAVAILAATPTASTSPALATAFALALRLAGDPLGGVLVVALLVVERGFGAGTFGLRTAATATASTPSATAARGGGEARGIGRHVGRLDDRICAYGDPGLLLAVGRAFARRDRLALGRRLDPGVGHGRVLGRRSG